jgi:hypothetical protein
MGHPIDLAGLRGVGGLREKPHVSDDETVANMGHPMLSRLFAEVGVVFVDPVLAGRGEDVEVDAVFFGGGGVRKVAGDDEDFAGVDGVGGAVVEVEAESALGDEGDLLVGVGVAGDDAAFGEDDAGEHGFFAGDEFAGEERIELLVFDVVPMVESGFGHGGMCLSLEVAMAGDEFLALCCALPCVE